MVEILYALFALFILLAFIVLFLKVTAISRAVRELPLQQAEALEQKHRAMLGDLHEGLTRQGDRVGATLGESSERLRALVGQELGHTRESMQVLQLSQAHELSIARESLLGRLGDISTTVQARLTEQGNADRDLLQTTLRDMTRDLNAAIESLTRKIDERLEASTAAIAGTIDTLTRKIDERLEHSTAAIGASMEALTRKTDERLDAGTTTLNMSIDVLNRKIDERLDQSGARVATSIDGLGQRTDERLTQTTDRLTATIDALSQRSDERITQTTDRMIGTIDALNQRSDERLTQTLEKLVGTIDALSRRSDERITQTTDRMIGTIDALNQRSDERFSQTLEKLVTTIDGLTRRVDERLDQISGRVSERLDEGFRKTNETFASVMARLATIDEAQKKIDGLTTNVVSLQELLGDKRSRGAFGEVQLEALVRNILPPSAYEFQFTLGNSTRADVVLKLPEPTGMVAVDSKFPLENYHRMFAPGTTEAERAAAQRQFKQDVRRHVDDIHGKYIVAGQTSDGAVMFVPAEAVFAEIHAYHADLVDYAMQKRVWVVSPTTLMAVLNTARAVLKDVETRRQVHIIKDELSKLGKDFARFDERMRKLADHIRQAHEDAERVHISSQKITQRFARIEAVELEHPEIGAGEGVAPVPAVAVAVPELPLLAPAGPAPGAG